jgi:GTP diphosphokinase / guanosine-3',5'-bis(diphosphate) 3'-diphosphatase
MPQVPMTRPPGRNEFFAPLKRAYVDRKEYLTLIGRAYEFSKAGHSKQRRDDGGRYFDHPKAVAWILIYELGITDWRIIVDALLHDISEDTYLLTHTCYVDNFGPDVAYDVDALTKRPNEKENLELYMNRLRSQGWRAVLVKIVDRVHNMRTIGNCSQEKQERKKLETCQHFLLLTEDLGGIIPPGYKKAAARAKRLLEETLNM